jgi:hypothetical protein
VKRAAGAALAISAAAALAIGVVFSIGACGGGEAHGDDTADDAGDDAGDDTVGPDADVPPCSVTIELSPEEPIAGVGSTVQAHAVVEDTSGFVSYQWDVRNPVGDSLALTPDANAETVTFAAETEGDYFVILDVQTGDGFCPQYTQPVHVLAPGANSTTWRIRITPADGIDAPPQEVVRTIPSLPQIDIGEITLDAGIPVSAQVRDAGGAGIAAYLAIESLTGFVVETYADATTGAVVADVPVGALEVLVVPTSSALAPLRIASWDLGPITVDAGTEVTGTIRDPAGDPLAGARVSLRVDGVPSTVGVTAGNGSYTLRARPGAVTEVTVVPPDASGLPDLTATLGALGAGPAPIDVDYAASITTRSLGGTIVRGGGIAAPAGRVTFTGSISAAGTATMGASNATAAGTVAITATANGSGALPASARAPARTLVAVVSPTMTTAALVPVDLTSAAPAELDAPAMVAATGRVVGPDDQAVADLRIVAIPTGALAQSGFVPAIGTTANDGTIELELAPGGRYDLVIDDPRRGWARRYLHGVADPALGDVVVEPAMRIRGTIRKPGGGAAGRSAVQVYCYACSGPAAARPEGEGSTSMTGVFNLVVTDPGASL